MATSEPPPARHGPTAIRISFDYDNEYDYETRTLERVGWALPTSNPKGTAHAHEMRIYRHANADVRLDFLNGNLAALESPSPAGKPVVVGSVYTKLESPSPNGKPVVVGSAHPTQNGMS
jgi:hypothetical protein